MIYPKGLSKNSTCMVEYRAQTANISYKLPLRSCNTMSTDVVSHSTLLNLLHNRVENNWNYLQQKNCLSEKQNQLK